MQCSFSLSVASMAALLGAAGSVCYGEETAPAAPAALVAAPAPAVSNAASAADVIVKVGDKTITQQGLETELQALETQVKNRGMPPEQIAHMQPMFKAQAVERLVARRLIDDACEEKKITIADDAVRQEIERFKANLRKDLTLDQVLKRNGLTPAMFESDVREQLKLEQLLAIGEPTDAEVQQLYAENKAYFEEPETVRARHILIAAGSTDEGADKKERKAKAEQLRQQLVEGADFEKLAREHSACPSKNMGGDLGPFGRGQMTAAFETAAFGLKTNEISAVVETEFGYHIIQTLEHREARTVPLEEIKSSLAASIKLRKLETQADDLIKDLKEKTKVEYLIELPPLPPMGPPPPGRRPAKPPAEAPAAPETPQDAVQPASVAPSAGETTDVAPAKGAAGSER